MNPFYTKLNETLQQGKNVVMATAVDCLGFLDGDREALIAQKAFLCGDELTAETPSMKDFWRATFSSTPEELPGLFGQDTWWTFFEPVTPRRQLILCGGGHIAQPLAQMGAMLDFDVTVIDDREAFANPQRFPQAKQVLCMPFDKALMDMPWQGFIQLLVREYCATGFVCGSDFRFGRHGEGTAEKLAQAGLPC